MSLAAGERRERGAALIIALLLVAVLGTASTLMVERSRLLARQTAAEHAHLRAFWAAEGGLARARHGLARDAAWHGSALEISGCAVATAVEALPGARWRVRVAARATHASATGTCTLEAELQAAAGAGLPRVVSWAER